MVRRWSGQWDPGAIESHKPVIARCSRKQIKAVLGQVSRITRCTTSACWRNFIAMARQLDPSTVNLPHTNPSAARQMSNIEWDPLLGEDYG